MGMAFLKAYEATGDAYYLNAAKDAARPWSMDSYLQEVGPTKLISAESISSTLAQRTFVGERVILLSMTDKRSQPSNCW